MNYCWQQFNIFNLLDSMLMCLYLMDLWFIMKMIISYQVLHNMSNTNQVMKWNLLKNCLVSDISSLEDEINSPSVLICNEKKNQIFYMLWQYKLDKNFNLTLHRKLPRWSWLYFTTTFKIIIKLQGLKVVLNCIVTASTPGHYSWQGSSNQRQAAFPVAAEEDTWL